MIQNADKSMKGNELILMRVLSYHFIGKWWKD